MNPKSGIYRALTATISFVKEQRIMSLKHAKWVVDVGAGKGQDLGRYLNAEIEHLVAVDKDAAALAELIRRRYGFAKNSNKRVDDGNRKSRHGKSTTLHILVADAGNAYTGTLEKIEKFGMKRDGADAVICNLAFHYFCGSVEAIRNVIALMRSCLKVGGLAVITILSGDAIHKKLTSASIPDGGTWDIMEGEPETRKYSIKKMYSSDRLEDAGQRIGVLLPFSNGAYYEEYLVNIEYLTKEFTDRGFSVVSNSSIEKSIPDFEARARSVATGLTPGDREYLTLFTELVFCCRR